MSLPIRLLPEAQAEFDQATDWYEDRRPGLGAEFVAKIDKAFDRIASDPDRYLEVYMGVRKAIVPKYPYVVLYRAEEPDEVLVISVFHTSRNPEVWKARA